MELETHELGSVTLVHCKGRLTYGDEADNLRAAVKKLLMRNSRILLNLAEMSYVDSGGLGVLFGLHASAQNAGGNLVLACATERVRHVLQRTQLASVIDLYDDEKEGIAALCGK